MATEIKTRVESPKDTNDISVTTQEVDNHKPRLDLVNTLMGGTAAMREAATKYLPQEPRESSESYLTRLTKTVLFNAFKRTIYYLGGQVFSKPVVLESDVPSDIKTDCENINLQGDNVTVFAKAWFMSGLQNGVAGCLVDYPEVEENVVGVGITKEEEKKRNLRPYWVLIKAEDIIGWKTGIINGKETLTQLRVRENARVSDGKYGTKLVERVRLFYIGGWELWEKQEKDGVEVDELWQMIDSGIHRAQGQQLTEIPIVWFRPGDRVAYLTAVPPLEDLAYLNVAHWQSMSDQRNILHFTRLPVLFGRQIGTSGAKVDEIELGVNRMIVSDKPDSDLKYVEHQGAAINSGRQDLIDLELRMALYGLQLLMPRTGDVTATERALSSAENDSTLKSWALMFQDALEQALVFTGKYHGVDYKSTGQVSVNAEFRLLQPADADVLLRGFIAGLLPAWVVIAEYQRRGMLSDDIDAFEIQHEMEASIIEMGGTNPFQQIMSRVTGDKKEGIEDTVKRNTQGQTREAIVKGKVKPGNAKARVQR